MRRRRGRVVGRGATSGRGGPRRGRGSSSASDTDAPKGNQEVFHCGTCNKELDEHSIGCDECEEWMHETEMCTGLTQNILDAIGGYNGQAIKFVCTKCRLKSNTVESNSSGSDDESSMAKLVGQLFQQLKGLCSVVQGLAEQVKSLSTQVSEKTQPHSSESATNPHSTPGIQAPAHPSLSYASVTASQLTQPQSVSEDYRKVVREELRELEEQRKRRTSLVIRGLGAPSAKDAVTRFETLSLDLIEQKVTLTDVVKIPSETDLYRGKVADDDVRKCLLDKAKNLKHSAQYSSVYIRRDLTYKQRQALKARREAATAHPSHQTGRAAINKPDSADKSPSASVRDPARPADAETPEADTIPKQVMPPSN